MDLEALREDIVFRERLCGLDLEFHATWGLFSPRGVDVGSRLLLDHAPVRADDDCLDLGCGYGAIGVTLARLAPRGRTWLVDKDFVAVRYARENARRNGLPNTQALLSNGVEAVLSERFDLIAANLPAKTGKELLYLLLADSRSVLRPDGRLVVVTLSSLRHFIARAMREVFGNYQKLKQGRTHTVSLALHPERAIQA